MEVVPLYGDMQIAPFNYIKKSPNFDPSKWPVCNDTSTSSMQGNLLMQLPEIREEHERFIADLARYTNEVCGRNNLLSKFCFFFKGCDTKSNETYRSRNEIPL